MTAPSLWRAIRAAGLVLVFAGFLGVTSEAKAQEPGAGLGGMQGTSASSGLHVVYNPQGLLPTGPVVELGAPDALATIAGGPATFARAGVADPGDLLANPDALLQQADSSWEPGTLPRYPYRVSARSGVGEPSATSDPAPGLHAEVEVDRTGSRASATTPAAAAPGLITIGSMESTATTTTEGGTVTVHARSVISGLSVTGLIDIESVVTDLVATSDGAETVVSGGTEIAGATVLGRPVSIDGDGVHVDGNHGLVAVGELVAPLNRLLDQLGVSITVAEPAALTSGTDGRLASAGLRITFEVSDESVPGLSDVIGALPPLENPLPGVPGVEDILAVVQARHITTVEIGRGLVSLSATPAFSFVPPTSPKPASLAPPGAAPQPVPVPPVEAASTATPPAAGQGAASPPAPLANTTREPSLGAGIAALVVLALISQPLLGDRIARAAEAVVASEGPRCPMEDP